MTRREFLQALALLTVAAGAPPFVYFIPFVSVLPLWRLNVTALGACVLG